MDDSREVKPQATSPINGAVSRVNGTKDSSDMNSTKNLVVDRSSMTNGSASGIPGQLPLPDPAGPQNGHHRNGADGSTEVKCEQEDHEDGKTADNDEVPEGSNSSGNESRSKAKGKPKKKAQRFYCTDYPPCTLSFTRGEHLARHIRKHTGERPFVCHCDRRFSRLDNLRQHAQTVHSHEEIPEDSPAAASTRYQRQIRPDKVPRGSAAVSGPHRGHAKSYSMSNIGNGVSTAAGPPRPTFPSSGNQLGNHMGNVRPRPPPLATPDPRTSQSQLRFEGNSIPYRPAQGDFRPVTPVDYPSPTSPTFSNGPGSPHWNHTRGPRPHSMYAVPEGMSVSGRRPSVASVESSGFHFGSPHSAAHSGTMPYTDGPLTPETTRTRSRRDSLQTVADEAVRRQTWHVGPQDSSPVRHHFPTASASAGSIDVHNSHNYPSSHPSAIPPPLATPSTQTSGTRLPGIGALLNESPTPLSLSMDIDRHPNTTEPAYGNSEHTSRDYSSPRGSSNAQRPHSGQWDAYAEYRPQQDANNYGPVPERTGAWAYEARYANDPSSVKHAHADQRRWDEDACRNIRFVADDEQFHQPTREQPDFKRHKYTKSAPVARHQRAAEWQQNGSFARGGGDHRAAARTQLMVHPNLAGGFTGFPARDRPQPAATDYERNPHANHYNGSTYQEHHYPSQAAMAPLPPQRQQHPYQQARPFYDQGRSYAGEQKREPDQRVNGQVGRAYGGLDALVAAATSVGRKRTLSPAPGN